MDQNQKDPESPTKKISGLSVSTNQEGVQVCRSSGKRLEIFRSSNEGLIENKDFHLPKMPSQTRHNLQ